MSNKFIIFLIATFVSAANASIRKPAKLKYQTFFGNCPSRVAGTLTITLLKEFEKTRSLKKVKEKIVAERLVQKHFLSDYNVKYNPGKKKLTFSYECPRPLMKVHIYKENGEESYSAILVESGKLFDPTYEVLLRHEKKLAYELPSLALPVGELNGDLKKELSTLFGSLKSDFRQKLSEIIIGEENELTLILSVNGRPSSAFLGSLEWEQKLRKLERVVGYMQKKKKIPSIINLTNSKKVVVKFSDKF